MPTAFTAEATGLSGRPKRIEVNGGGTSVTGDQQLVVYDVGDSGRAELDPTAVKTAEIHLREDADFTGLVGQGSRAVPVQIYDTTGGTDLLEFQGFLITDSDHFSDSPYRPASLIKMTAVDGLKTLDSSQDPFSDLGISSNDLVSVTGGLSSILNVLYQAQSATFAEPTLELGTEWFPGSGGLTSSDCPLAEVYFDPQNYLEERPPNEGTEWWNQYQVLRDLLKANGLVLRQTVRSDGIVWHARQRSAIDAGTITVWDVDMGGLISGPTDLDLSLDVSGEPFEVEHSRGFKSSRIVSATVYDHTGYDDILENGDFEGGNAGWTQIPISQTNYTAGVDNYPPTGTDYSLTPFPVREESQDNAQYFHVLHEYSTTTQALEEFFGGTNIPDVGAPTGAYGRLDVSWWKSRKNDESATADLDVFYESDDPLIRVKFGGYYLTTRTTEISVGKITQGSGASMSVQALDAPIPEGATLYVKRRNVSTRPEKLSALQATFTLEERAEAGDRQLVGELGDTISVADTQDGRDLQYLCLQPTSTHVNLGAWTPYSEEDTWKTFSFLFSWDATDGTRVEGDGFFELGANIKPETFQNTTQAVNPTTHTAFDTITYSLEEGGSVLDQTVAEASVSGGEVREEITSRTKSGPSVNNLSRLRGLSFEPTEWGTGAGHSSTLSLGELHARERLRYWRDQNEKLQLTLTPRDQAPQIHGDEWVTFDGTDYTVAHARSRPMQGEIDVTLVEFTDYGTTGITITTRAELSEGGQATTGGATGTGITGGGTSTGGGSAIQVDIGDDGSSEVSDLEEIATTNDPGVASANSSTRKLLFDYSAVVATSGDQMTGDLDLQTNALIIDGQTANEISDDTTLADSSSTALVTENAIKSYIDSEAGAQALDDLTDVTLTHTSKYDPEDILAGDDNGKFTDKTINTVLNEAVLKDVGDVVTANRDDNDVLTWDGGNSQYDHTAPSDLLSEVLALNDLSDVRGITDYDDGDILAVDSTLGSSGEFTERTISDVLQYGSWENLGNVDTGGADGGDVGFWNADNTQWEPISPNELIKDHADTGIFNDVAIGGLYTITQSSAPTLSDWNNEYPNANFSSKPENGFWFDDTTDPDTPYYFDPDASSPDVADPDGGSGGYVELAGGLFSGGLLISDTVDADKVDTNHLAADNAFITSLTAEDAFIKNLTSISVNADYLTANDAFIDDIENITFTGQSATIERKLQVGTGDPHILIDGVNNRIESSNYASLVEGMRVQTDGFAEFNDVRVRGEIRSSVFRVNTQVGVGGTQVVAPSTTLAKDASSGSTDLWLQDEIFRVGDDIRLHEEGVTETVTIGSGPVLHTPLDGDADSLIGPDGTINGDPTATTGVSGGAGQALDFDGTGDYIVGPNVVDFGAIGSLSASVWVNFDTLSTGGYQTLIAQWDDISSELQFLLRHDDSADRLELFFEDDTSTATRHNIPDPNTGLSAGKWTHVVFTWDGSDILVYVDAVQVASFSFSGMASNTPRYSIGAKANGDQTTNGQIDEPRIYDRALSASEVSTLFNNPTSPPLFASASSALSSTWTKGAAAVQWSAERIVDDAQSEFAPFRSYIDSNNEEFMRLGNIAGRTQLTGNGMVVGDHELVFSTDNDLLEVRGRVAATTGEFGPFSIGAEAIASPHMMLSEADQAFQISTLANTDLNVITNRDFSSTDSNDQPTGWPLSGVKSTGVYAYPYIDTGSNEKKGELQQTVDYSASAGEVVTWQLEVSTQELEGYKVFIEIQDKVSGDYLANKQFDDDTGGSQTTFSVKAELPLSDASQIEIHIKLRGNPTGDTNETRLYSIKSYSESAKAELKESGIELFGDSQQRTFYAERTSGNTEVHGTLDVYDHVAANDLSLGSPIGTSAWFEWFTAEPLNFQDSSGNTQTENAAYWDVSILSFDSFRNSNPEPPTPSSGIARLWIQNDQLRIKYPDGTTAIIGP